MYPRVILPERETLLSHPQNGLIGFCENIKMIRCHSAFLFKSAVLEGHQTPAASYWGDCKQFTQTETKQNNKTKPCLEHFPSLFLPPWFSPSPLGWSGHPEQDFLRFSAVDCHCGGFLSKKEFIRLTLWPPSLGGTEKNISVSPRIPAPQKVSLSSERERVLSMPWWLHSTTFPLLSFVGKNPLLSLLGSLAFVGYKGQIFFCKSLVIKWALQWWEPSMACFLGFLPLTVIFCKGPWDDSASSPTWH